MKLSFVNCRRVSTFSVAAFALCVLNSALAEEKFADPIYRVANNTTAAQSATTTPATPVATTTTTAPAVAGVAAGNVKSPFDLTKRDDKEHPLKPVLRALKISQEEIDHNVRDYSCTLIKRERVDGELGDYQNIFMKVMHQPFSVYMSFLKPYAGREVLYVEGQNNGKMTVLEAGFTRMLGKIDLDPNGTRAMSGQKHPITDVGMRNLTAKLIKMWEAESQFQECTVTNKTDTKVGGRPATMVRIDHPKPRQNFKFNVARLFFDNELKVPVHFDAYIWPTQVGGEPQLEESYTYSNLKINNGFTARDFDATNNPDIFKK